MKKNTLKLESLRLSMYLCFLPNLYNLKIGGWLPLEDNLRISLESSLAQSILSSLAERRKK